jgi:hypothetical protein
MTLYLILSHPKYLVAGAATVDDTRDDRLSHLLKGIAPPFLLIRNSAFIATLHAA